MINMQCYVHNWVTGCVQSNHRIHHKFNIKQTIVQCSASLSGKSNEKRIFRDDFELWSGLILYQHIRDDNI